MPKVPANFTVLGCTAISCHLKWLPYSLSSSIQTFLLQYKMIGQLEWSTNGQTTAKSSKILDHFLHYRVKNLAPDRPYLFRLRAQCAVGKTGSKIFSTYTPTVIGRTKGKYFFCCPKLCVIILYVM